MSITAANHRPAMPVDRSALVPATATGEGQHPAYLCGEVLRVVFASDDGEYAVLRLTDDRYRELTAVGPLGGIYEGQDIELWGAWETHKEHGHQFRAERFRAVLPQSERGIRRYLASGLVYGIGPKLADRIVERFGTDTLRILDHYSMRLTEVPGIGKKRVDEIRKAWRESSEQRDVTIFLQGLGLTASQCAKLYRRYGVGAAEVVRRNPYQLAQDVHGMGFATADRIAGELGIGHEAAARLVAGVIHALRKCSEHGHVCFPRTPLIAESATLLGVEEGHAISGLDQAREAGLVVVDEEASEANPCVYLREFYRVETDLAATLRALVARGAPGGGVPHFGGGFYDRMNAEQQTAVRCAFESSVSIITGGPGVGKTTVVGEIVRHAKENGLFVLLAAPTGRAAKRLSESSRLPAKTIHRLLKWDPQKRTFVHNADRPLRCDMVVVDEVSMLDVRLALDLLQAVPHKARVVFVGDRDQLPSVGPGAVLHDLICSRRVPVTALTTIYRQSENSRIVTNAHCANRGEMPDLRRLEDNELGDFYWIDQEDPERVVRTIATMVRYRIPERFRLDPMRDVQVLTPMNRGGCGAEALNRLLQQTLNARPPAEFRAGERILRVRDRVMQIVNNYDKGVFNGDLGWIQWIDSENKTFKIAFDEGIVEYEFAESDQVRLAYAVTVHKSQGSEFPVVVMPVLTQHFVMLQRNLIYTGMTRARKLLVMIGTRKALAIAVRNDRPAARHTRLAARLRAE